MKFFIILVLLWGANYKIRAQGPMAVNICFDQEIASRLPKLVQKIAKIYRDMNFNSTFHFLPSARSLLHFEQGKCDILPIRVRVAQNYFKNGIMLETPIISNVEFGLWKRKGGKNISPAMANVASARGAIFAQYYTSLMNIKSLHLTKGFKAAFDLLDKKRVDYVIAPRIAASFVGDITPYEYIEEYNIAQNLYHVISKKLSAHQENIEKKIQEEVRKGNFNLDEIL